MGSAVGFAAVGLVLLCWLGGTCGHTSVGCQNWDSGSDSSVCCTMCYPGNRLVKKCGINPKELCTPCEQGTYTLSPAAYTCLMCTQCIGLQVEKEPCTSSKDAVCGCKEGYRCGDTQCSYCIEECGKGYEPTEEYSCRKCPHGTFNNKIHQKCIPWRKSCPQANQQIVANGTTETDSDCVTMPAEVSLDITSARYSCASHGLMTVAIAIACFCLGLLPSCFLMGKIYVNKKTTAFTPEKRRTENLNKVAQPQSCLFSQPEQEQGGSIGSISSDNSQKTLLQV